MSEAEKQEGQKTVVAFITGLLIGGLLVWVFSSTPEQPNVKTDSSTDTEEVESQASDTTSTKEVVAEIKKQPVEVGDAKIEVADQAASDTVGLTNVVFPKTDGWVVVRDYMDGIPGNVLGAVRYSTTEGLTPKEVLLLRKTETGSSYQVMFYADNGDKSFFLKDDAPIDGVATTFKAN